MERVAYRPIRGAPGRGDAPDLVRGRPDPPERDAARDPAGRQPDADRLPVPGPAQRRRHARLDHDPEGEHRELRAPGSCCSACSRVFVTRTTLGLSMRAAAEDLPAARLMGIKVDRVVATAFAIGAGLAAVAGLLYSVQAGQINPYMGFTPVLKAFIAAVIGGFGSIAGRRARRVRPGGPGGARDVAGRDRRPAAGRLGPARGAGLPPAMAAERRWRAGAMLSCSSC